MSAVSASLMMVMKVIEGDVLVIAGADVAAALH